MTGDRREPELGRAGRRLLELLPLLVDDPDAPAPPDTKRVMRSVRWERALRIAAQAIGNIAFVIADGLTAVARPSRPDRESDR